MRTPHFPGSLIGRDEMPGQVAWESGRGHGLGLACWRELSAHLVDIGHAQDKVPCLT